MPMRNQAACGKYDKNPGVFLSKHSKNYNVFLVFFDNFNKNSKGMSNYQGCRNEGFFYRLIQALARKSRLTPARNTRREGVRLKKGDAHFSFNACPARQKKGGSCRRLRLCSPATDPHFFANQPFF